MPCERHLVLPLPQQAKGLAFFHQAPKPSRAEPVGFGFGEGPVAPIGKPEARLEERVGRAVEVAPESPDEKVRHGPP